MRHSRQGWLFIGAAVVLAGVSAALARLSLPAAVTGGVAAGLSVLAGVWSARGTARLQAEDTALSDVGSELDRQKYGDSLPLVRDSVDPRVLGVHPAAPLAGSHQDRLPPFVSRSFSGGLEDLLDREQFVLLVGESTAGKSRAAYELIRRRLPGHRLVQPASRSEVQSAAGCVAATPQTVLWLDDLERFLGSGGLTGAEIHEILMSPGEDRYIVATMRSEEYAKFSGRISQGLGGLGRDALRQGWDVLRLAARVEVARQWSAEEIDRARQMTGDPRLEVR
jgi:eukaryotic-like serine/threonine-protein kinase